jgi:hypothetical protein
LPCPQHLLALLHSSATYCLLLFPQHLITLLTKMLSQITLVSLLGAAMILMLATVSYQLVLVFCLQLHFNEALTNYLFHSLPFPFLLRGPRMK